MKIEKLERVMLNFDEFTLDTLLKDLKEREDEVSGDITSAVTNILNDVRKNGDKALREYTEKFDKVVLKDLQVTEEEIEECFNKIDKENKYIKTIWGVGYKLIKPIGEVI